MRKLKKYSQFRKNYNFEMPPLVHKDDKIYFLDQLVEEDGKKIC